MSVTHFSHMFTAIFSIIKITKSDLTPFLTQLFCSLDVAMHGTQVLFIATANSIDTIPAPLLDRMEIIQIPGYTLNEKLAIASQYIGNERFLTGHFAIHSVCTMFLFAVSITNIGVVCAHSGHSVAERV